MSFCHTIRELKRPFFLLFPKRIHSLVCAFFTLYWGPFRFCYGTISLFFKAEFDSAYTLPKQILSNLFHLICFIWGTVSVLSFLSHVLEGPLSMIKGRTVPTLYSPNLSINSTIYPSIHLSIYLLSIHLSVYLHVGRTALFCDWWTEAAKYRPHEYVHIDGCVAPPPPPPPHL